MRITKIFTWAFEGVILLGVICITNAQLFGTVYYFLQTTFDKLKAMIV